MIRTYKRGFVYDGSGRLPSLRLLKYAVLPLLAVLMLGVPGVAGATASDHVTAWLAQLGLPSGVIQALQVRRHIEPQAPHWLAEDGQSIYLLVTQSVPSQRAALLRQGSLRAVEMRARHGLLLYAAGDFYEQLGFTQREAIAKALAHLETQLEGQISAGLRSRTTAWDSGVAAVVWIRTDQIMAYRQHRPDLARFLPAYCEALYPTALALYKEKRYHDALALYSEMHTRQCKAPVAYFLDAAECFAALDQIQDAKRMVEYVLRDPQAKQRLDSLKMQSIGDLFLQIGDETAALKTYEQALHLLRNE